MTTPSPLAEVLAKLRERFAATADSTLAAFSAHAEQLERAPVDAEALAGLHSALHRVHGTAGSYGFHEASRLAGALELVAARWIADPGIDRGRRSAIVRQFVRALGGALAPTSAAAPPPARRLFLVGLPDEVASPLVAEGLLQGYFVERTVAEGLSQMLAAGPPLAILAMARDRIVVPEGVSLVLLRDAGDPVIAPGLGAPEVDASADAAEVMRLVAARER